MPKSFISLISAWFEPVASHYQCQQNPAKFEEDKMLNNKRNLLLGFTILMFLNLSAFGQMYEFTGVMRNTDDYTSQTPVTSAEITVYDQNGVSPGTTLTDEKDLTDCSGNQITNPFTANGGSFCFRGTAATYDISVSEFGKKRRIISEQSIETPGVYKLTDFGALGDASSDNTYILTSAVAYIGTRPEIGGKLIVPNGIFKVFGGNAALPAVLPPGLNLEGLNGKGNFGSSRIQMEVDDKTLFRIGNNTYKVTVRDLSLVVPLVNCQPNCTIRPGTKAIYAAGDDGQPSGHFVADNLNIQGFEEGISVEGLTSGTKDWQFASSQINNSVIADTLYPVRLAAQNAEFQINNSILLTIKKSSGQYANQEASLRIDRAGPLSMKNVYGGVANRDVNNRPLAFIWVNGRHSSINLVNCQSENTLYNFLYDFVPPADDIKPPITFEGVGFGDLVVFKGNIVLTSVGSSYGSNSVQVWGSSKGGSSTASEIYSYGDQFAAVTTNLQVCPAASGVTPLSYPEERPNGDFHRLTVNDITPVQGNMSTADVNVCRRDFYIYNTPSENNRVVVRTAQRKYSVGDSASLNSTQIQGTLEISQPPIFDEYVNLRQGIDRFKAWGYRIERNNTDAPGALDFIGNQVPPHFETRYSFFRFNGGLFPTDDDQFELGSAAKRWSVIRGVQIISGDLILSDRETGKQLYKIREDEKFIYFEDFQTGKLLMRLGRDGNLYLAGKVIENAPMDESKEKEELKEKK